MEIIPFSDKKIHTVTALYAQENGELWVGTTTGLFVLNPQRKTIQPLNLHAFFENNAVHTFFQNKKGLWIGTRKGVAFIGKEKRFLTAKKWRKRG